ncbi:RidA family protein [Paracoccus onubensis]|uniref:RidA family protein n=1 Tax=Paracoccus onubensis TaxID=1675788 RepID=A0A418ST06_9RHOB|nr:RidA family protein [Paracoccus onubensis]RJE83997.1 RidA family protein [Paracoccus onubensis]
MSIENRLAELGITLPDAPAPAANYVPFAQSGNLIFISGQISADENGLIIGKLGENMETEAGAAAARRCGLALIAQLKAVTGSLDKVKRVVKLSGFVNSTPDFTEQPKVINGCSDLMVEIFGDAGRHARAAVSAPSLPLGVAVEIEAIFEVE